MGKVTGKGGMAADPAHALALVGKECLLQGRKGRPFLAYGSRRIAEPGKQLLDPPDTAGGKLALQLVVIIPIAIHQSLDQIFIAHREYRTPT